MKLHKVSYSVVLFFTMLLCMPAFAAQDTKIGFVDTIQLMKDSPQAEFARKKLEQEFHSRDQKIVEMQKEEKNLEDQLSRDVALTSDLDKKKLERDLQSLRRDIKRAREEIIEDYNLRRNEEIAKLQKLIDKITIDIAKEDRFDLILRDNVLYSSKRVDITEKVLERLRQLQRPDKNKVDTQNPSGMR